MDTGFSAYSTELHTHPKKKMLIFHYIPLSLSHTLIHSPSLSLSVCVSLSFLLSMLSDKNLFPLYLWCVYIMSSKYF